MSSSSVSYAIPIVPLISARSLAHRDAPDRASSPVPGIALTRAHVQHRMPSRGAGVTDGGTVRDRVEGDGPAKPGRADRLSGASRRPTSALASALTSSVTAPVATASVHTSARTHAVIGDMKNMSVEASAEAAVCSRDVGRETGETSAHSRSRSRSHPLPASVRRASPLLLPGSGTPASFSTSACTSLPKKSGASSASAGAGANGSYHPQADMMGPSPGAGALSYPPKHTHQRHRRTQTETSPWPRSGALPVNDASLSSTGRDLTAPLVTIAEEKGDITSMRLRASEVAVKQVSLTCALKPPGGGGVTRRSDSGIGSARDKEVIEEQYGATPPYHQSPNTEPGEDVDNRPTHQSQEPLLVPKTRKANRRSRCC